MDEAVNKCATCGKPLTYKFAKYCPECRKARDKELRREWKRKWNEKQRLEHPERYRCTVCGAQLETVHKMCAECRRKRNTERMRLRARERRAKLREMREAYYAAHPEEERPHGGRPAEWDRAKPSVAAASTGEKITKCKGCKWWKILSAGHLYACHYAILTGKLRKIPAKECYRHAGTPYEKEVD